AIEWPAPHFFVCRIVESTTTKNKIVYFSVPKHNQRNENGDCRPWSPGDVANVATKATPMFSSCTVRQSSNHARGAGQAGPAGERARSFEHTDGELMEFMHTFEHNQLR